MDVITFFENLSYFFSLKIVVLFRIPTLLRGSMEVWRRVVFFLSSVKRFPCLKWKIIWIRKRGSLKVVSSLVSKPRNERRMWRRGRRYNLSNQQSITKTPPWIQVLPLFLLLLFLICIYLLPWGKKRYIVLIALLITLCPIKLPSLKAFVSAISSTKIPSQFGRSPQSSSVEESYDRRNGGSKEERHLGTDHVTKRQTYGWLQVGPETQSWWLYREGSYCGERFQTNL